MASKLETQIKRMFKCDNVRVSKPLDRMFLIIGWKRSTTEEKDGAWFKNGERIDFAYTAEKVIASGGTEAELLKSAREYERISNIPSTLDGWETLLKEQADAR